MAGVDLDLDVKIKEALQAIADFGKIATKTLTKIEDDARDIFKPIIDQERQVKKTFDSIKSSASGLRGGFSKLQAGIITANQGFELLGRTIQGLRRIVNFAFSDFAEFETALVGVGKTANLEGAQLLDLGEDFKLLSEEIPKSAAELAGIGQIAGQLGVTGARDILKFTETIAKLESASNLTGEEGATALARILNITEGGVQNIDRFASSIVALGNSFAANEKEIARGSTEIAKATAQFGVSSADVAGLATALKAVGQNAELGASVIGKAFRLISKSVTDGGANFSRLTRITGLTGDQLRKTFKTDAVSVFRSFIEGLGRISKGNVTVSATLETLGLRGDEVNKVLPVLALGAEKVGEALDLSNKAYRENVALNKEFEIASRTLTAVFKKFTNIVTNAAIELGEVLAPIAKELIELFKEDFKDALNVVRAAFSALASIDFKGLAEGLTFFATALGLISTFAIASVLAALAISFKAIAIPIAITAAKIAVLVIGVVAAATAFDILVRNAELFADVIKISFSEFFESLARGLKGVALIALQTIESILEATEGSFIDIGGAATELLSRVRKSERDLSGSIDDTNKEIAKQQKAFKDLDKSIDFGFVGKLLSEGAKAFDKFNKSLEKTVKVAGGAKSEIKKLTEEIPEQITIGAILKLDAKDIKLGPLADALTSLVGDAFKGIKDLFTPQGIQDAFSSIVEFFSPGNISAGFSSLIQAFSPASIRKTFSGLVTSLKDFSVQDLKGLGSKLASFGESVGSAFSTGASLLKGVLTGDFINQFANLVKGVAGAPEQLLKAFENLGDIFVKFANSLPETITKLVKAIPEIVDAIVREFPKITKALVDGIPAITKALTDAFPKIIQALVDALPEIAAALAEAFLKIFDALLEALPKIIDAIPEILNEFIKRIPEVITILLQRLPAIITSIFEAIPKIVQSIVAILPDIFIAFADNIAPVITAFTEGFITAMPEIVAALEDELIIKGGIFRIGFAMARAFIFEAPKGFIIGLRNAAGNIWENFGRRLFKGFAEAFATLGANFPSFGQIFSSNIKFPEIKIPDALKNPPFVDDLKNLFDTPPFLKKLEDILNIDLFGGGFPGGGKGGGILGGITSSVPGFQHGGRIPQGFPNDTFLAGLSSGETVVPTNTSDQLSAFLDSQQSPQGGFDQGLDSGQILDLINQTSERELTVNLTVSEEQIANVNLNLDRQGFRVA